MKRIRAMTVLSLLFLASQQDKGSIDNTLPESQNLSQILSDENIIVPEDVSGSYLRISIS